MWGKQQRRPLCSPFGAIPQQKGWMIFSASPPSWGTTFPQSSAGVLYATVPVHMMACKDPAQEKITQSNKHYAPACIADHWSSEVTIPLTRETPAFWGLVDEQFAQYKLWEFELHSGRGAAHTDGGRGLHPQTFRCCCLFAWNDLRCTKQTALKE